MFALMRPLKSLTNVNSQFQRGMAACQTLFSILDTEQEKDEGTKVLSNVKGDIEFENVTFTYATKEHPALDDISFTLPAGKSVALVGRSGSGKSTIANLITRFYDIDKGSIRIDGHDIRNIPLSHCVTKWLWFHSMCICLMIPLQTILLMQRMGVLAASKLRKPQKWLMRWTLSRNWIKV